MLKLLQGREHHISQPKIGYSRCINPDEQRFGVNTTFKLLDDLKLRAADQNQGAPVCGGLLVTMGIISHKFADQLP